jgi:tetratricopeptide (TPR) repeat protein
MARGQTDLSLAESRRCLELDPVDLILNVHLIWHYWLASQPDEAIEQGNKTRELYPNAFWPEFFIGLAYEDKLMPEVAVTHLDKAATMSAGSPFVLAALGHACAAAEKPERTLELLRRA